MALKINNKKGLTLLEVIISLGIISIMAASFITFFGVSFVNVAVVGDNSASLSAISAVAETLYATEQKDRTEDFILSVLGQHGGKPQSEGSEDSKFDYSLTYINSNSVSIDFFIKNDLILSILISFL